MTEAEWLGCNDSRAMLHLLQDKASDRKLRLFAVACCRRVWHLFADEREQQAVAVAEKFADGAATEEERASAAQEDNDDAVYENYATGSLTDGEYYAAANAYSAAHSTAMSKASAAACIASDDTIKAAYFFATGASSATDAVAASYRGAGAAVSDMLRDIFSNPFRPVTVDPAWRTATVTSLAQAIYTDRAYDHMPILADALEDAGCTDIAILDHCRQPGEHVRGCWVIDLVLDKE